MDPFVTAAEPREAESHFAAFLKSHRERFGAEFSGKGDDAFLLLFGNSRFLCENLIRDPGLYDGLARDPFRGREKPLTTLEAEIRAEVGVPKNSGAVAAALKRCKYREYLRLTLQELALRDQEAIYREFSNLACVTVRVLADALLAELAERHDLKPPRPGDTALVAMGKLGGLELNYSSDIDLIGLYEADADWGEITAHEFFAKFFARLGTALQSRDSEGFLYRVDWDLRPEGKTGTLANSLAAMEDYYESFGAEWERQAFIKAAPLYQQGGLAERFLAIMVPFTYRKYIDGKVIRGIRDVKERLAGDFKNRRIDGVNVKLSPGGIRDVEFLVQGLQLLHGGKHPALRTGNTSLALRRLAEAGFLDAAKARALAEGYFFLRRVESALQMGDESQTHVLKNSAAERLKTARRAGFRGDAQEALDAFNARFDAAVNFIRSAFEEFYG